MKTTTITLLIYSLLIVSVFPDEPSTKDPADLTRLRNNWEQAKKRALDPINKKYQTELKKLKVKYTKQGKLEEALAIRREIESHRPLKENTSKDTKKQQVLDSGDSKAHWIIGKWEFDYEGKKRNFEFMSNSEFTGQLSVDGSTISGKWIGDGKKITLWSGKPKFKRSQHLNITSRDTLIFVGPSGSMKGVKK